MHCRTGFELPSRQSLRRVSQAEKIQVATAQERNAVAFAPRVFSQVSLPHTDPGLDLEAWVRRNGAARLIVQSGVRDLGDGGVEKVGVPYGSMARLLILFLSDQAVRTRSPEIFLGRNLASFIRALGLARDGRTIRMLKMQLDRLVYATIRFTFHDQEHLEVMSNVSIADDYILWWDHRTEGRAKEWGSYVKLHQRFFQDILEHGFPIDLDAVRVLRKSPLALDLYCWLAYRIRGVKSPVRVPWAMLHQQVGSDYTCSADFKKKAKRAMLKISAVWNGGINFRFTVGALRLEPSPTAVPPAVIPIRTTYT